jgi:hypothetical protein
VKYWDRDWLAIWEGYFHGAKDVDADNNLGIFGGIEYAPTKQLTLGGELRLLSEVSIGLVATFVF